LWWIALRRPVLPGDENVEVVTGNANAQAGQSSSTAQPPSATAPYSIPQEPSQAQPATPHLHEDEPDYGCWGNFLHAVCCIPHARGVVPAVQSS